MMNPITLSEMSSYEKDIYNKATGKYIETTVSNGITNFRIKSNTCKDLDVDEKNIIDEIARLRKSDGNNLEISFLDFVKQMVSVKFNQYECSAKIGLTRLEESANLITKNAINQEVNLGKKSFLEQNIYIFVGGFVLLTAIYIVTKKK